MLFLVASYYSTNNIFLFVNLKAFPHTKKSHTMWLLITHL